VDPAVHWLPRGVLDRLNGKTIGVLIRRSKTDQEGHGETIAIVRGHRACPVKAVKAWLSAAGITEGPLFRPVAKGGRLSNQRLTDKRVCDIVKRRDGSAIADHQPKRLPCVNRFAFSEVIKV